MAADDIDPRIIALCAKVTAKRARRVLDYILKNGSVTSEQVRALGYDDPRRGVRDVREEGIPIITTRVRSPTTGRLIGCYSFDSPDKIKKGRIGGRRAFSKAFKQLLIQHYGSRDEITSTEMEGRYLQIDHRIPYEVAGEPASDDQQLEDYMLLEGSSNRAKSWSCEHCRNWLELHDPEICRSCYWAYPKSYHHIAMQQQRRVDVVWQGDETRQYDAAKQFAESKGITPAELVKDLLSQASRK